MNTHNTRSKRRRAPLDGAYRCASKNRVISRGVREQTGAYLIELLIALLMATLLAGTLCSVMSQNLRLAASNQNDIYADNIVSELANYAHGLPFTFLEASIGSHTLQTKGVHNPNIIRDTPVQANGTPFFGDVTFGVEADPTDPDRLFIDIKVTWSDSEHTSEQTPASRASRITVFRSAQ